MHDTHVAEDVPTGQHQLEIGAPPVLSVQPRWLADRLNAHHERGAVQRVDHLIMPCSHLIRSHHSAREEVPDVVAYGVARL